MVQFEIITRAFRRPTMLAVNQRSLAASTYTKWKQTLFVDEVGIGVPAANAMLASVDVTGDYIWILDDDDRLTSPNALERVANKLNNSYASVDAIVVQMDHGRLGVLPSYAFWHKVPPRGQIGVSSVIASRQFWYRYRDRFLSARYDSDYDYVSAVLSSGGNIIWHDGIVSEVQRISRGAPE